MSYFKQIASRARPPRPGRAQSLPLLHPTQALFRPVALVEPLELPDQRPGSDESERVGYSQVSTISSVTQSISSSATTPSPLDSTSLIDSNDVPSPAQLPATPLTITPSQDIPPIADLSLPLRDLNLPDSRSATPTRQSPVQNRTDGQGRPEYVGRSLPIPLSASPSPLSSPQMSVSSGTPDLHRDSPQHLVPINPIQYSGADQKPTGRTLIQPGDQATVNSVSVSNLTTEIAQPLRTTLEPKHSTQVLVTERMAESFSQLPSPPSLPGSSKPDRSQRSTIHIGAIDIQITPPVIPQLQPSTTRSVAAATTGSLSRGFASGFGLRQG